MHQNAPFIPLNIKNRLPKEGGTPLLQPPSLASCGCSCRRRPFRLFLQNFLLFSNLSTSLHSLGFVINATISSRLYLNTELPLACAFVMSGRVKKHTATQPIMPEMRLEPLNVCLTDRRLNQLS